MDNIKKEKNKSGWGALFLIGAFVALAALFPSKSPSVTSTLINCYIDSNCGGGVKEMTSEACYDLRCCHIGSQWVLKDNASNCKVAQDNYNAALQQNVFKPEQNNSYSSKASNKICCKHCTSGKPCGDTCISLNKKCHVGPGCAC